MRSPASFQPLVDDSASHTAENTYTSVLTERPGASREPLDTTFLWYAMAVGLCVLVGVAVWKFLEGKADQGEQ